MSFTKKRVKLMPAFRFIPGVFLVDEPPWLCYFNTTDLDAEPPRLLRTVMFCGLDDHENSPR
jgi:hypothetical protein